MGSSSNSTILKRTVEFLLGESRNPGTRHLIHCLDDHSSSTQLQLMRQLLCIRAPYPELPEDVLQDIEGIIFHERNRRVHMPISGIPCVAVVPRGNDRPPTNIRLWRGDITTLAPGTTAIVNAANTQMLGCFQPMHRCIDNVIHSWAGPRLRQTCAEIASARRYQDALPIGDAVTTHAYCLPCDYVIHTVGPQLSEGSKPNILEKQQLSQCYYSVLDEVDRLPDCVEGKSVALCGISTGLFAFPTKTAARIAVDTVAAWLAHHPDAIISDVVFVTYTEDDHEIYAGLFKEARASWGFPMDNRLRKLSLTTPTIQKARSWLLEADAIIVSAGAGFSAADGLDYTSRTLFRKHFPAFIQYGIERLYDVFGFTDWPSERVKWAYYFTHLNLVTSWPRSELYRQLIEWLDMYGDNAHVRTSNADGFFIKNGWSETRLSTPQGRYEFLQCVANCTPDSYQESREFLEKALTVLDPATQVLKDDSAIPKCKSCGGDMFICVRAADWFNERPYAKGETRWRRFREGVLSGKKGNTVILELGVGMNTPSVLKWPNEDLVRQGEGRIKLVRMAVGSHAEVPWELEEEGLATGIDGDISIALSQILPDRRS